MRAWTAGCLSVLGTSHIRAGCMTHDHALEPLPIGSDGWTDELRETFRLAWPLALANLLQMLVHAVDVIFVARLGEKELAASALGVALFGLTMWAFTGLVGMVAALIAEELGRRRHSVREVRRSVRMAFWLSVVAGLVGMAICWQGEALMRLTGQQDELAERAGDFLVIIMFAMWPMIGSSVLRNFVSALGRPVFATAITGVALVASVVFNYAFVFGHFGAPAMGLEGSALASVCTAAVQFASYLVAIRWDRRLRRYRIFGNWWKPEWPRMRELVVLGTPVMVIIIAEAGLFSGAALLMGRIGPAELAGHTIALQIAALAFQIPFGLGQAATIRVGYHYGARDREAMGRAGWVGIGMGATFMLFTASLMILAPVPLLRIYIDPALPANAAMVVFAVRYMKVAAAFQLFDGVQAVAAGALRGLQDTRVPMLIAVFSYWIPGFGVALWLGFRTPLEGTGVWIGLATGLIFAAALLTWRWARRETLELTRRSAGA